MALGTVIWKEWRETVAQFIANRMRLMAYIAIAAYFAFVLPTIFEAQWLSSQALVFWILLPTTLVLPLAADTFAGERERHSLETLLALPIDVRSLLFGKLFVIIGCAWGFTQVIIGLSIISANLLDDTAGWHSYSSDVWIAGVVLSLAATIFLAGLGVFVSMHMSSVKQAQMLLGLIVVGLMVTGALVISLIPEQSTMQQNIRAFSWEQKVFGSAGMLLLFAQAWILLSKSRLQRA